MGYSLTTPLASVKKAKTFMGFLRKNLRSFCAVMDAEATEDEKKAIYGPLGSWIVSLPSIEELMVNDPTVNVVAGKNEVAYGSGVTKVGFNYHVGGVEHPYMMAVCAWMALRGGMRRKFKGLKKPVAYMTYDSEAWPVLRPSDLDGANEDTRKKMAWAVYDEYGFRPTPNPYTVARSERGFLSRAITFSFERAEARKISATDRLVQLEMRRLDALWEKEHG